KTTGTQKFPSLSYSIYGAGDVIILLHGFPLDGRIWDKIVPTLAEEYLVVVPDLPGSGKSTFEGDELSMEDMAGAVKLIMDAEDIDKAIIAGHSMGGYDTMALADLYPERLKGFGLIHSFAKADADEKKEQRRKSMELFRKVGRDASTRQIIPALVSPRTEQARAGELNELINKAVITEDKSLIAFYTAMINRPDRTAKLGTGEVPVLWVIGADDTIATPENLIQQTSLANVNFVYTCNNCGHMSMIESP